MNPVDPVSAHSTAAAEQPPVLLSRQGAIATITLNRPASLNSLNEEMGILLLKYVQEVASDGALRVVILTGSGASFQAGGDLRQFADAGDGLEALLARMIPRFHTIVQTLREMPKVVLGSVRGGAAGGGFSLAMASDLIVASETARFATAYRSIGASPDGGLSYFLATHVGPKRALELLLHARAIDARQAQALGLVNWVVADGQLEAETARIAGELAAVAPKALHAMKRLVNEAASAHLGQQLDAEQASFIEISRTRDFREGLDAFLSRRKPAFEGR